MRKIKKGLAMLLAALMLVTILPTAALANAAGDATEEETSITVPLLPLEDAQEDETTDTTGSETKTEAGTEDTSNLPEDELEDENEGDDDDDDKTETAGGSLDIVPPTVQPEDQQEPENPQESENQQENGTGLGDVITDIVPPVLPLEDAQENEIELTPSEDISVSLESLQTIEEAEEITPFSLLPLEEVNIKADIVIANLSDKSQINLYDLFYSVVDNGGGLNWQNEYEWPYYILWNVASMDDPSYVVVYQYTDTVDLSSLSTGDKVMFIGGSDPSQFNMNNKRYILTVNFESLPSYADIELYFDTVADDTFVDGRRTLLTGGTTTLYLPPHSDLNADYRLLLSGIPKDTHYYSASVYRGAIIDESQIPSDPLADVTNAILGTDGLQISFIKDVAQSFSIVFRNAQNAIVEIKRFDVKAEVWNVNYPDYVRLSLYPSDENGLKHDEAIGTREFYLLGGYESATYSITNPPLPGYSILNSSLYLTLAGYYYPISTNDNFYEIKIYEGEYTAATLATATNEITADILGQAGWKASFAPGTPTLKLTVVFKDRIVDSILSITTITVTITEQAGNITMPTSVRYRLDANAGNTGSSTDGISFGSSEIIEVYAIKPLTENYYLWFNKSSTSPQSSNLTSPYFTVKVFEGLHSDVSALSSAVDITDLVFTRDAYEINFGGENIEKAFTFLFDKVDGTQELRNVRLQACYENIRVSDDYIDYIYLDLYKDDTYLLYDYVYVPTADSGAITTTFQVPQIYTLSDDYSLMGTSSWTSSDVLTVEIYKGHFTGEPSAQQKADDNLTNDFLGTGGYSLSFANSATHDFTFVYIRKMDGLFLSSQRVTVGATSVATTISYPNSATANLYTVDPGAAAMISTTSLSLGSGTGRFTISQRYPLADTYALRLPNIPDGAEYSTQVYIGSFTDEAGIPTDPAADITAAIAGTGYDVSFASAAKTEITFVFTRKPDGQFLDARPVEITAEHRDVVFPSYVTFDFYAPKSSNWSSDLYELLITQSSILSETSKPMLFFPVQPKVYSLLNDSFGIAAVPFSNDELEVEVYRGIFDDLNSLIDDDRITDEIYGRNGFITDFNNADNERDFTFVVTNKYNATEYKIFQITIGAIYFTDNLSDYAMVDFTGALNVDEYKVRKVDDSYAQFGYQTFFLAPGANLASLMPVFDTYSMVGVYANGLRQTSEVSSQNFANGPVLYTAVAEDTKTAANYQVTYLTQTSGGANLFVNGPATREVYFDNVYGYNHDILIANIGNQQLRNITVTLENAVNVKLDDYWTTVSYGYSNSLAPFDTVDISATEYGQLPNIAKIRLLSDETGDGGPISGTLRITAADNNGMNMQTVTIDLVGFAGKPELTTSAILPEAVKYVPYSVLLQTNNIHTDKTKPMYNRVTFELIDASPDANGLEVFPNGEIYGVPKESGDYTLNVRITYSLAEFDDEEVEFTLTVNPNTDQYVDGANDYPDNMVRVPNMTTATYDDHEFDIDHDFDNWTGRFFLNGRELIEGLVTDLDSDYYAEEGSTKITIRSQTFQDEGVGTHTIAAEFRDDGGVGDIMTKGTQNYTVTQAGGTGGNGGTGGGGTGGNGGTGGGGTGGGGTSDGGSSDNGTTTTPTPTPTPTPTGPVVADAPDTIIVTIDVEAVIGTAAVIDDDGVLSAVILLDDIIDALMEEIRKAQENPLNPVIIVLSVPGFGTGAYANATAVNMAIPMEVIRSLIAADNISLRIDAGHLGVLTLNNQSLNSLAANAGVSLEIDIAQVNSMYIGISIDGARPSRITGGFRVALPGFADDSAIILIRTDAGEEILKKSIVENGSVYALLSGSGTVISVSNTNSFADINPGDWFYGALMFANSRSLFNGISETEMAPQLRMSRAMLATVLHSLENHEQLGTGSLFNDVVQGTWYADGIAWASSAGIVSGYGNGVFGPGDDVTREQLAVMLMNYARHIDMDTSIRGDVSGFLDAGDISTWANDAMRWAVGIGIMRGDGRSLRPSGNATRAEAATMIMNFISILAK